MGKSFQCFVISIFALAIWLIWRMGIYPIFSFDSNDAVLGFVILAAVQRDPAFNRYRLRPGRFLRKPDDFD